MIPGMMGGDSGKKAVAALILSGPKKESGEKKYEEESVERDSDVALGAAADDILGALEAKDSGRLKSALKSFIEMCSYDKEDEGGDDDDSIGLKPPHDPGE